MPQPYEAGGERSGIPGHPVVAGTSTAPSQVTGCGSGRAAATCNEPAAGSPRAQGEVGVGRRPWGSPCAPRLAHPFRPPLPLFDPLGEQRQVGTSGDAQRRLECPVWPQAIRLVLFTGAEELAGPFGQQIPATVGDHAELSYRSLGIERFLTRVAAG